LWLEDFYGQFTNLDNYEKQLEDLLDHKRQEIMRLQQQLDEAEEQIKRYSRLLSEKTELLELLERLVGLEAEDHRARDWARRWNELRPSVDAIFRRLPGSYEFGKRR